MDATPALHTGEARRTTRGGALLDGPIVRRAALDAFAKLDPRHLVRKPVIFVTEIVAILVTPAFRAADGPALDLPGRDRALALADRAVRPFAEAVAEGRGRAQAGKPAACADRDAGEGAAARRGPQAVAAARRHRAARGRAGAGRGRRPDPSDGEVVEGIASVNEAAVTGESAPVIRESGGDRSAVTGGTLVVSDWIVVRITAAPGSTFPRPHDRAGRGRVATEDAQRNRARHPARGHDDQSS